MINKIEQKGLGLSMWVFVSVYLVYLEMELKDSPESFYKPAGIYSFECDKICYYGFMESKPHTKTADWIYKIYVCFNKSRQKRNRMKIYIEE